MSVHNEKMLYFHSNQSILHSLQMVKAKLIEIFRYIEELLTNKNKYSTAIFFSFI